MLLKNYKFKFKLFPTLMFVITFCGFIILGFWQIDRADQKNNINTTNHPSWTMHYLSDRRHKWVGN